MEKKVGRFVKEVNMLSMVACSLFSIEKECFSLEAPWPVLVGDSNLETNSNASPCFQNLPNVSVFLSMHKWCQCTTADTGNSDWTKPVILPSCTSGSRGPWGPATCPQDFFEIMQFPGNFEQILGSGPPSWGQNLAGPPWPKTCYPPTPRGTPGQPQESHPPCRTAKPRGKFLKRLACCGRVCE